MYTSSFYKWVPVIIQNSLISLRGLMRKLIREKNTEEGVLKEINQHFFDNLRMTNFAENQLNYVLGESVKNIPFYQRLGLTGELKLEKFPYICKENLVTEAKLFKNTHYKGVVIKGETSGTTGLALMIPQNLDSVLREQAFVSRYLNLAGYRKGDKRAWIRGDVIVPINQKSAPYWRYSYFEDMILLSSFHLLVDTIPLYINAMVQYGVSIIQAYPSSIISLAKYLDTKNLYYPGSLKAIITSSESLTIEDKKLVEKRFRCIVFDWYGQFERVAAIGSCEQGRYHIFTDYSYVELLPAGKTDDGYNRAEIVGTNFNNSYYPLIRYKTGDHVVLSNEEHCPCGLVFPIVTAIEGRSDDYIIAEDGQKVSILNHIPKGIKGVLSCQFYQHEMNKVEIRIVVEPSIFNIKEQNKLINNTKERLGRSMNVLVKRVLSLEKTKAGKVRHVICEIEDIT